MQADSDGHGTPGCSKAPEGQGETGKGEAAKGAEPKGEGKKKLTIGLSMDTLKEERWQHDRDLFIARGDLDRVLDHDGRDVRLAAQPLAPRASDVGDGDPRGRD
jgi:hypothetical protein